MPPAHCAHHQTFANALRWIVATFVLLAMCCAINAATLPDTGQTDCYTASAVDNSNDVDADTGSHPRQDCRYGADAATPASVNYKTGVGGEAGFDYTALDATGAEITAIGLAGPCVRDNLTGLVWEVKTDDGGLHDKDHTYTWYSTDGTTNGGAAGTVGGATCGGTLANCDTQSYVAAVNAVGWCGFNDWRMPSLRELLSIVHYGRTSPAIEPTYFQNTLSYYHWTADTVQSSTSAAWSVLVGNGGVHVNYSKSVNFSVRLVRGGQF
jgi:hypothetical protein